MRSMLPNARTKPEAAITKLSIFKKYENYLWLDRRLLSAPTGVPPHAGPQIP
jgi:hypothetical protein